MEHKENLEIILNKETNKKYDDIETDEILFHEFEHGLGEFVYIFSMGTGKCMKFFSGRESKDGVYNVSFDNVSVHKSSEELYLEASKETKKNGRAIYSQKIYFVSEEDFNKLLFTVMSGKDKGEITLVIPGAKKTIKTNKNEEKMSAPRKENLDELKNIKERLLNDYKDDGLNYNNIPKFKM